MMSVTWPSGSAVYLTTPTLLGPSQVIDNPQMTDLETTLIVKVIIIARRGQTNNHPISNLDLKYILKQYAWLSRNASRMIRAGMAERSIDGYRVGLGNNLNRRQVDRFMRLAFKYRHLLPPDLAVAAAIKSGGHAA